MEPAAARIAILLTGPRAFIWAIPSLPVTQSIFRWAAHWCLIEEGRFCSRGPRHRQFGWHRPLLCPYLRAIAVGLTHSMAESAAGILEWPHGSVGANPSEKRRFDLDRGRYGATSFDGLPASRPRWAGDDRRIVRCQLRTGRRLRSPSVQNVGIEGSGRDFSSDSRAASRTNPAPIFGFAIDRNGWVPVHNRKCSLPQRPGDPAWNSLHCRNLRIFDDRAGLAAARNVRPSLIQTYNRDLGSGVFALMKEVDAPIRIFERHWGGFRMGYEL